VDSVDTYLLLATSFDGTMATVGKFSSVRVVCQNTLSMSLNDSSARVSVPHSAVFNVDRVKQELGIYAAVAQEFQGKADLLAGRKVSDKEAMRLIIDVLAGKDVKPEDLSTRSANVIKAVFNKYAGAGMGATLKTADGTAWGVVNAVTEYVSHDAGRNTNNRMRSAWFGKGDMMNQAAMQSALALCA
jgi:phage/plasmid-like protein (TIGR03299 family)